MKIYLNGEARQINDGTTLGELLTELELTEQRIAVEINLNIIPRSLHAETPLQEGDKVEVVRAIGGG